MKLLERLVLAHLKKFTDAHLDPLQFAYRANRSVEDAINACMAYVSEHLDNPASYARILFLDFSSAFNTICPDILLSNLTQLGVDPTLRAWIKHFLTNRTQQVIKFADDTTIIGLIGSNGEQEYRGEVESICNWCGDNNLVLNAAKTVELVIDFRRNPPPLTPVLIGGNEVSRVSSVRFLGTTLTNNLKWEQNTIRIQKKSQQRLFFLRQLKGSQCWKGELEGDGEASGLTRGFPLLRCLAFCPRRCSCDSPRTMQCFRISDIPAGTPASTRKLYISHSKIRKLQLSDFAGLSSLQELVFFSSGTETIENNTFRSLSNLKTLEVWKNKLTAIPRYLPPSIEVLKLGDNSIHSIHHYDFDGLNKLKILEMQNNLVHSVSLDVFASITNIQRLILDNNGVQTVHATAKLTQLKYLSLENNRLLQFHEMFFLHLPSLQYLRLAGNQLARIPAQLPRSLLSLKIERNLIQIVRVRDVKHLENLYELNLSGNQLSSADGVLAATNLTSLDVSTNHLSSFPNKLPIKLQRIDFSNNQISRVTTENMKGLSNLRHLFLDNNGMILFEDKSLQGCVHLSNLAMEQNLLTSIPQGLPSTVLRLDLKGNKIEHIGGHDVNNLKHLQVLNLRNNKITSLDHQVLECLPRLRHLYLDGNPWNCTCKLLKVRRLLIDKGTDTKEGYCVEPSYCRGERWMSSETILRHCESIYTFHKGKENKKKLKFHELINIDVHSDEDYDYDPDY
ncbi:nephrocan-like [Hyperolius riggenbachi]|uniref:nephrocan-like n=1 Tax=Hyperolius riggenbachi TaxID=752182 RepID=UPI0035A3B9B6